MRDIEIRDFLKKECFDLHTEEPDTLVVDELKICGGRSIADLAIVNGALHGFEIKSKRDNLDRLSSQVANYSKVFDYVTLVVDSSHTTKAMSIVPKWWEIWTITDSDESIRKVIKRRGRRNRSICLFSIAQFLSKEEAQHLLLSHFPDLKVKSKRRWTLWEILADNFAERQLSDAIRAILKNRISKP